MEISGYFSRAFTKKQVIVFLTFLTLNYLHICFGYNPHKSMTNIARINITRMDIIIYGKSMTLCNAIKYEGILLEILVDLFDCCYEIWFALSRLLFLSQLRLAHFQAMGFNALNNLCGVLKSHSLQAGFPQCFQP